MPSPRVWLITSVLSPLGHSVALDCLQNGDLVVGGCLPGEVDLENVNRRLGAGTEAYLGEEDVRTEAERRMAGLKEEGKKRIHFIELDVRTLSACQSAVAEVISRYQQLDILLNNSTESYFGLLSEMPLHTIQAQFEATYFGTVNIVKATLPTMRKQKKGHILCTTGSSGQMGDPGLGARCAADHAVEGFLDALKFEIAPWDLRVTVIEPPFEASVLSNPLTLLPVPTQVASSSFTTMRTLLTTTIGVPPNAPSPISHPGNVNLDTVRSALAETTEAIMTVAGHASPPVRVVVGEESIQAVMERIRTISEEMEEFLETSMSADLPIVGQETKAGGAEEATAESEEGIH